MQNLGSGKHVRRGVKKEGRHHDEMGSRRRHRVAYYAARCPPSPSPSSNGGDLYFSIRDCPGTPPSHNSVLPGVVGTALGAKDGNQLERRPPDLDDGTLLAQRQAAIAACQWSMRKFAPSKSALRSSRSTAEQGVPQSRRCCTVTGKPSRSGEL